MPAYYSRVKGQQTLTKPIRLLVFRASSGDQNPRGSCFSSWEARALRCELVCGISLEEEEGSVGKANGLKCYKVNKESRGQQERKGTAVRECPDVTL